uniref:Uncharacterized protein n=1 Tax=Molossus molossus TaxID=27622 RepID=A0A7J8CZ21_MOLMO|nr:hypothetical protein HJG59_009449 [Molossus molossus]
MTVPTSPAPEYTVMSRHCPDRAAMGTGWKDGCFLHSVLPHTLTSIQRLASGAHSSPPTMAGKRPPGLLSTAQSWSALPRSLCHHPIHLEMRLNCSKSPRRNLTLCIVPGTAGQAACSDTMGKPASPFGKGHGWRAGF